MITLTRDGYRYAVCEDGKKLRIHPRCEGTRAMYRYGSNSILKVDKNIAQSISEYHNYHHTPDKWKKFLAPATHVGVLPDDMQEYDTPQKLFGWVVQRRIPILRIDGWRSAQYKATSRAADIGLRRGDWFCSVDLHAELMEAFAEALYEQVSMWSDGGPRQYSIVRGRVCLHDYASCRVWTEQEYASRGELWEDFDNEWDRVYDRLASPFNPLDTASFLVVQ